MNQFEFSEKVYSLRDKLFRFAKRILNDSEEANDSVQDVMIKLWNKRTDLPQIQNLSSYAYTITRNMCYDKLKHLELVKKNAANSPTSREGVELSFNDEAERLNLVRKIIQALPELQREIIHLRDIEELEMNEISEITGLNENAIRVNLSRARKKVRDEINNIYSYGLEEYRQNHQKILRG